MRLIEDFPQDYAKYYSLKEYTYNKIRQPNRNRLLFLDPRVDGVKTGHTDAAGTEKPMVPRPPELIQV